MSNDPSPWAGLNGESIPDEPIGTTAEMLRELEEETKEEEASRIISAKQWEAFAHRLTLKGDLIR